MKKLPACLTLLLFACVTCLGQTSYKGLKPGQSTRADAERVLGRPVRAISGTLLEYKPPVGDVGKLYVQYGDGSPGARVERIELVCEMGPTAQRGCNIYLGKGDRAAAPCRRRLPSSWGRGWTRASSPAPRGPARK